MTLTGELDLWGRPQLADAVARLATDGATDITVDAGGLGFIDSSGLTALVYARIALTALGIGFRLDPVTPGVRRVIDLAGLGEDLLPGD